MKSRCKFMIFPTLILLIVLSSIAIWCSKYWGYILTPRPVDPFVSKLSAVVNVEEFRYSDDVPFYPVSVVNDINESEGCEDDPLNRIPNYLSEKGVPMPMLTSPARPERRKLVEALGVDYDFYYGRIYVGESREKGRYIVLAGISFPLDHRRYTEAMVSTDEYGNLIKVHFLNQFYYDVAGFEHLTPVRLYAAGLLVVFLIVGAIVLLSRTLACVCQKQESGVYRRE